MKLKSYNFRKDIIYIMKMKHKRMHILSKILLALTCFQDKKEWILAVMDDISICLAKMQRWKSMFEALLLLLFCLPKFSWSIIGKIADIHVENPLLYNVRWQAFKCSIATWALYAKIIKIFHKFDSIIQHTIYFKPLIMINEIFISKGLI